jgi:hypothetical protein
VNECRTELGVPSEYQVSANLYKVLLYGTGGHFGFHRDTEKETGMFGTLIIQLPCDYTGGALIMYHARQSTVANMV